MSISHCNKTSLQEYQLYLTILQTESDVSPLHSGEKKIYINLFQKYTKY